MSMLRLLVIASCLAAFAASAQAATGSAGVPARPLQGTKHAAGRAAHLRHGHSRRVRRVAREVGLASWYGRRFRGGTTASGETFDERALTAAHRSLPLHSLVRVTNIANGRSVTVEVTDRGPRRRSRIIDLSQSAAAELGMKRKGIARVRLHPVQQAAAALPAE